MQDAWRAYLELAMGLTEAPRKKTQDVVRRLAGTGGATAVQLQGLAEELVSTGLANREALTKLVRFEVDRALGVVGLATAEEVAELNRRVRELEGQLRAARGGGPGDGERPAGTQGAGGGQGADDQAGRPVPTTAVAPQAVGGKAVAKKAVAGKAVAKKAVAKKAVAPAVAPKGVAPAVAPKGVAKKAVARRNPAEVTRTSAEQPTATEPGTTPTKPETAPTDAATAPGEQS
jgi:hypothetical protein